MSVIGALQKQINELKELNGALEDRIYAEMAENQRLRGAIERINKSKGGYACGCCLAMIKHATDTLKPSSDKCHLCNGNGGGVRIGEPCPQCGRKE